MSTPEDKLVAAAGDVKGAIEKVKSVWASHEIYIVAAVCLIVGAIVGHKI